MLIKASHEITRISDNENVNSSNYFESLSYINNLYFFINKIKKCISTRDFTFKPTFKGFHTCEKFGISSNLADNEMRRFLIISELFLEDVIRDNIRLEMSQVCESIIFEGKTIEFILR